MENGKYFSDYDQTIKFANEDIFGTIHKKNGIICPLIFQGWNLQENKYYLLNYIKYII